MIDNRRRRSGIARHADGGALHASPRIVARLLIGALRDRDALHADPEPLAVHHREHRFEAAIFVADAPADRAPFNPIGTFAIGHHAGRGGVDAELFFEAERAQIVARAR